MRRGLSRRASYLLIATASIVGLLCVAALVLRPLLERTIRSRIEAEAVRRGLVIRMNGVRVGLMPPVRLTGVAVETKTSWHLSAERVDASWLGHTRLSVRQAMLSGPAGLTLAAAATVWEVQRATVDDFHIALLEPQPGLTLSRVSGQRETAYAIEAHDFPVGRIFDIRRLNQPLLEGGTVRGAMTLKSSSDQIRFSGNLAAQSARLPALAESGAARPSLGEPTEVAVQVEGNWNRPQGSVDIPGFHAKVYGAALAGALALRDLEADPRVDLSLDVQRVDFARLLRTWGLDPPGSLGLEAGDGDDLGSATLAATAQGRIAQPASFVVTQKLDFTPPRRMPPAVARLRGNFVQEIPQESGAIRKILVSPSSPDFIPLDQVPPLFLRALLIAEDAGFYGHPGIDLRELPAAIITDWNRGGAARGASTITQQLAKNLFLSREKQLGRKLQELSVTFLLESALTKGRILEIYLNVIQWGPGLYGLRPAARTYFGKEPAELTPVQMAFLVSIIPGPLKYQSSFAHGTPGPGLRKLVNTLLAKLRSVDALTEEEYQAALGEEIVVLGRGAPAPQTQPAEPPEEPEPESE